MKKLCSSAELSLSLTLPTGQSFKWKYLNNNAWYGVLGSTVVNLRQADGSVFYRLPTLCCSSSSSSSSSSSIMSSLSSSDQQTPILQQLRSYFHLSIDMKPLLARWCQDQNIAQIAPKYAGLRLIHEDPLECLISFICSSNNNISRIEGMLDRLRSNFGTFLGSLSLSDERIFHSSFRHDDSQTGKHDDTKTDEKELVINKAEEKEVDKQSPKKRRRETTVTNELKKEKNDESTKQKQKQVEEEERDEANDQDNNDDDSEKEECKEEMLAFYAFPTLDQLSHVSEAALRELGFGYRASYIVQSVQRLIELGGEKWLLSLRSNSDAKYVKQQLMQLQGVGPKVADCVSLFSLEKYNSVPVDTHVYQIACRLYKSQMPSSLSKSKAMTKKLYNAVVDVFQKNLGDHAGWAHCLLFVDDLNQARLAKFSNSSISSSSSSLESSFSSSSTSHASLSSSLSSSKTQLVTISESASAFSSSTISTPLAASTSSSESLSSTSASDLSLSINNDPEQNPTALKSRRNLRSTKKIKHAV